MNQNPRAPIKCCRCKRDLSPLVQVSAGFANSYQCRCGWGTTHHPPKPPHLRVKGAGYHGSGGKR